MSMCTCMFIRMEAKGQPQMPFLRTIYLVLFVFLFFVVGLFRVCVCVCVCVCMSVYVSVAYVCGVCLYACVSLLYSITLYLIPLKQGLRLNLELTFV